jgi:hypothetical protein
MTPNTFFWTKELTDEFSKVVLDNYHCLDDIEKETENFIKKKIITSNGKHGTLSGTLWEVRNLN